MALWQARYIQWLLGELAKSLTSSSRIGPITLDTKQAGKPSAGKQPAGFDEAGTGNQLTVRIIEALSTETERPKLGRTYGAWRQSSTLLLKPHVHQVLVCDPRRNALLKEGSSQFESVNSSCVVNVVVERNRDRRVIHQPTPTL